MRASLLADGGTRLVLRRSRGDIGVRSFDPARKILEWEAARVWREERPSPDRVVFTNGVFDLLHPGHIDVLRGARVAGTCLIVGLNSDASVQRLKGPTRPIRSALDRAYVLAALECVDAVVVFEEDTPLDLIRFVRPDVLVKGGDYTKGSIVGADVVETWGGTVIVVPLTPQQSTTSIVRRIETSGAYEKNRPR